MAIAQSGGVGAVGHSWCVGVCVGGGVSYNRNNSISVKLLITSQSIVEEGVG